MAIRHVIAAALLGASFIAPAGAQERLRLEAGFQPDPRLIEVQAGGSNEVEGELGENCIGWISNRPSVELRYTAGREELFISARSDIDTTLMVRTPSGRIVCSDDRTDEDLNPGVSFDDPESGTYEIFVGTYDDGGSGTASVLISEVGFEQVPTGWGDPDDDEVADDHDEHGEHEDHGDDHDEHGEHEDHGPEAGEHG